MEAAYSPCSCGVGLVSCGLAWLVDRSTLQKCDRRRSRSEVVAGRYAIACRDLEKLLVWRSDPNGGITYLLGSCELARENRCGRRGLGAGRAGFRVLGASDSGAHASRTISPENLQRPRSSLTRRVLDRRNDPTALRVLLVPKFVELGRIDEAERLVEDRWEHLNARGEGALEPAINLLLDAHRAYPEGDPGREGESLARAGSPAGAR